MAAHYIIAKRRSLTRSLGGDEAASGIVMADWRKSVGNTPGVKITAGLDTPGSSQIQVEAEEHVIESLRSQLGANFIVEKTMERHPLT